MAYSSACTDGRMPIIDDDNYRNFYDPPTIDGVKMRKGHRPRDYNKHGFAAGPYMSAFPSELIIDPSEYKERIKEKDAKKNWVSNLCDNVGSIVKNQASTPFCWINAGCRCMEIARVVQGEPQVVLSPASAGAPITGFVARGGYGTEGVQWLSEHGACPVENWPANAIQRKYYTEENKAIALKYRIDSWWDLHQGNTNELASCLLRDIPVAAGLGWWSHEITFTFLAIAANGDVVFGFDNSWGTSWGDNGRGILVQSKARFDDANAIRAATPTVIAESKAESAIQIAG